MNPVLSEIKPETIVLIEEHAKQLGVSVDEYLRLLLPPDKEIALKPDADDGNFELDMDLFAKDTESSQVYNGSFSREDIYFDHD